MIKEKRDENLNEIEINKEPIPCYNLKLVKNNKNKESEIKIKSDRFVYTIKGKGNLKEKYIEMIRNAKKTIYLINWLFVDFAKDNNTQSILLKELTGAADRLKGKLFIITASKNPKKNPKSKEYFDSHLNMLKKLYEHGAFIKGYENAHTKLLIIDNKKALITSANYTYNSFNKNVEVGTVVSEPKQIAVLIKWFFYIWNCVADNYFLSDGSFKGYKQNRDYAFSSSMKENHNIYWTYKEERIPKFFSLKDKIKEMIKKAKKKIIILTYSFDDLSEFDKELKEILEIKIRNGILVEFITTTETRGDKKTIDIKSKGSIIKSFSENIHNVKFYADSNMHAKMVFIDDSEAILFTGNIDRHLFETKSLDVGVFITDKEVISEVKNFVTILKEKSEYLCKVEKIDSKINQVRNKTYNLIAMSETNIAFKKYNSEILSLEEFCDLLKNNLVILGNSKRRETELYCENYVCVLKPLNSQNDPYKIEKVNNLTKMRENKLVPVNSKIKILVPPKKSKFS